MIHALASYLETENVRVVEFARRVGVSRVSLHRIIKGDQRPQPDLAHKIIAETGGRVTLQDIYPPSQQEGSAQ